MYATLAMGGNRQSHKQIDDSRPWVMRIYYSNTKVLFTVCALNELFFIALYLLSFSSSPSSVNNPNFTTSQSDPLTPWSSSWSAGAMEVARANKIDDSVPWCLLHVSTPFMLFKQYVNMIQLTEASKWLVEGDLETRRNERLAQKRDQ
ncbi:CDP-diacylglycerol--inositol 3-phosphatidyltransferase [Aspergillus nomiae NRRL 13137]|uniref:CDP-diacylglycerol--inositol 3-phosphatidyltransferase n=1 Tax=Aspergillus nomiae NRRL (strain ATCC 15546 / NRRL 13137 / CBS 260.88 / M93) TaxID=1509407 RepID=A0A0L1JC16_ASPN3|nr:CDP-diacylglycerol--inositol 3-phosphatidyltransferase [Aspergillus nomiae NRRL 13137]KNG88948.1 CDP-diacylglycerol--inositol 3-phosphatidyltransferase [Aspergillus nomiae NRRL 13137]